MSLDLNYPQVGVKPVLEPVFSSAMRDSTKRLFHSGEEPSKLDQDDLEALVYANIKPSLHLTIHRWKKLHPVLPSLRQNWPSTALKGKFTVELLGLGCSHSYSSGQ